MTEPVDPLPLAARDDLALAAKPSLRVRRDKEERRSGYGTFRLAREAEWNESVLTWCRICTTNRQNGSCFIVLMW